MSYLALYRKYRPYTFDDVIGQEHIVRTLKNQISSHRVAHAYLFSGSRGTGKTTIAKIFARAVNCLVPVNGSACGECEICKKVNESSAMNIIEIDAASHNGVDNIREINDEVKYTPAVGQYKVYIIDEVHMLSVGAFNALLKTLEEPPAHVIFILATTDPQKIPVTILSRCQRFDFKRISASEIEHTMKKYMENEQIDIEDNALAYIARLADGGMRDALSILEQSISFYYGETITLDKVQYLVGAVDTSILFRMVEAIANQNTNEMLILCDEVNAQGRSLRQFSSDLLEHCRNLLVAKTTKGGIDVLDYSSEHVERLRQQAETIETSELMRYIKHLAQLEYELRTAISPRILLEVALLKLCEVQMDQSPESMMTKMQMMEKKLEKLIAEGVTIQSVPAAMQSPREEVVPTKLPEAVPDEVKALKNKWNEILNGMGMMSAARAFYTSTRLGYIEGDILYIVYQQGMEAGVNRYLDEVKVAINQFAGKEVKVRPMSAEDYASKSIETYGTSPKVSEEVKDISSVLRDVQSKINFHIDVT
ncbi:MAG: DNA polymerase III subunit gamma/tau [Cellulosilyticum sp.]|nr:DNA polymerase III subunit gamma/tau [Cellulosilyticum sp.]